ncbi:MAG: hypothetical protein R3F42_14605 [Pseudomonadota bacterium]
MGNLAGRVADPGLYLQKYDFEAGVAVFRDMTRDSFRQSSFLDSRIVSPTARTHTFALDEVLDSVPSPEPARLLFHTAYCCSTLMSRALDVAGSTLVYREPVHLHQLAVARRRADDFPRYVSARWGELLRFSMSMLSKGWHAGERSIIKPTDSCNNIIADILSLHENSRAVLLYAQADDFIAANLKSAGRRMFMRRFVGRALRDNMLDRHSELHSLQVGDLTEAQLAAYVWMTQVRSYNSALDALPHRCVCVDSATLLDNARCVLSESSDFLGLGLDAQVLASIMQSGIWNKHAKDTSKQYTSAERQREMASLMSHIGPEVNAGLEWIERFDGWKRTVRYARELNCRPDPGGTGVARA